MKVLRSLGWLVVVAAAACAKAGDAPGEDTLPSTDVQSLGSCGDGTCESDESCGVCEVDCGACEEVDTCGDGLCGVEENCNVCPDDCGGCGPGSGSSTSSGTGVGGDDGAGGAGGAGVFCGNGSCDPPESASSCPTDCQQGGSCAHDVCVEGVALEPTCDPCAGVVCSVDAFCCDTSWDELCVDTAALFCGCS